MRLPTSRRACSVGIASTVLAAVFVVGGGPGATVAVAAKLVDSAGIRDNTIRSVDVRDETLQSRDIKNGSLKAEDFDGSLSTGSASSERVATWHLTYTEVPGSQRVVLTSNDTVPAGTQIEGLRMSVQGGDFARCTDVAHISVRSATEAGKNPAGADYQRGGGFAYRLDSAITTSPGKLEIVAECSGDPDTVTPPDLPSFEADITLAFTQRNTTPNSTFN